MRLQHFIALATLLVASSGEDFVAEKNSTSNSPPNVKDGPTSQSSRWRVGQPVKTTSGTVIGHPASKRPEVSEYLGIRFAKPPVGNLRFGAPQPYRSYATYEAAQFSPDCPANVATPATIAPILPILAEPQGLELFGQLGQVGNNQSEDCLTLNVWTKPQVGAKKKAVMIWIFGGGFSFGTSNLKEYNGQYFADDDDVVLVSFNYRTNVFGFPGLPDIPDAPQNPGLMDQRLAIEWVRDNIDGFGGDPKRITLFGQSAGASSVDIYSYAYTRDPIVQGFIAESGSAISFDDPWPSDRIEMWYNMSSKLGCGGEGTSLRRSLRCVRTKPVQDILSASLITNPLQALIANFGPTVDDYIVFKDYHVRGALGDFIQKPYFTGNTFYEAGLFKLLALAGGENISDSQWAIFNEAIFQCSTASAAQARVLHGVPTYRYLYFGDFFNLALSFMPPSGAYHTAEIPIVFETTQDFITVPSTAAENKLSRYMNAAWAAFAKDPSDGLTDQPWFNFPHYNPLTPSLLLFGATDIPNPSLSFPIVYDALCPLLDSIAAITPGGLPGIVLSGSGSSQADESNVDAAKSSKPSKGSRSSGVHITSGTNKILNNPKFDDKANGQLQEYLARLRGEIPLLKGAEAPKNIVELPSGPLLDEGKSKWPWPSWRNGDDKH